MQVFIYPRIAAWLGVRRVLQIGLLLSTFVITFMPLMTTLTGDIAVVPSGSSNLGSSNFSLNETKPTPTLFKENSQALTEIIDRRTRLRLSNYKVLTPSLEYNMLGPSQNHGKTPVLKLSSSRLMTLPYEETFSAIPDTSYLTMTSSFLATKKGAIASFNTTSLFTSLHDKTSAFQLYPTKVQVTFCGTCSSSVNVSVTFGQTITPKAVLPDIPVGQCKFDVELGNKTEHLTVSQMPIRVWFVAGIIIGVVFSLQ